MADTAIPLTSLAANTSTDEAAGTAIVHANTHVVTPTKRLDEIVLRLVNTTASEKTMTILKGDNPPADASGQGDLTLTFAAGNVTPVVKYVAGLDSARFIQNDGTLRINVASSTTGTITAYQLPG